MRDFIHKALYPLNSKDYKKITFIFIFTILNAFFEIIGIGLMIPMLNIFIGNEYLHYISYFPIISEFNKLQILKLILGVFIFIYFVKFLISRYLIIIQAKFTNQIYADLSKKFFQNYLKKSYIFHTQNNSSSLIRNVSHETNIYSFGIILPLIIVASELIIFLSISTLLLIYDVRASLFTIIFFMLVGFFIFKITNKKLKILGGKRQFHASEYIKQLQQGFFSFREVLINGLQETLLNKFSYHISENIEANRKKDVIQQMPRLILELLAVLVFVLLFLLLILIGYEISNIFILVGLFFYAAIRLLPSISKIVQSIQAIRFNMPAVHLIYKENLIFEKEEKINIQREQLKNKKKFNFFKSIIFKNVSFSYPNTDNQILKNLNLKINRGDKIGIMGKTGSGKSTFINLFCGLLESNSGQIYVDEKLLKEFLNIWQNQIGYVPQTVSIFDESVLFNITLTDKENEIDLNRVNNILKLVDLDQIVDNLPNKIKELVGEHGAKISGGQSQRLGLARALYREPNIVILDEATSGLDENTENLILEKLFKNKPDLTIITISHRKNSLKHCDKVLSIENCLMNELKNF
tara:strand:- start:1569 stop:3308 length:1740 start_codon:yes stop_codon:yes gene_type:complete